MTAASEQPWDDFRRRMPAAAHWAYFDHAAVAPLCGAAQEAAEAWAADTAAHGDVHWKRWRSEVEVARRLGAELIGAEQDEIALVNNTTAGISLVAEGAPWQDGDNVVVPAGEFPSNLYPWMNLAARGVELRRIPVDDERLELDRLEEHCDERTRIVSVSWVGYATGWRNDLDAVAEITHRKGALLFVDAIQGLGVLPLDVTTTPIDFLAADGHKWLLGPEGAGLFYVRREHLDRLRPLGVGWNSVRQAGDFANDALDFKPTAGRYEGGSYNMAGIAGLAAALRFLREFGTERIAGRLIEVTDRLCDRLAESGAQIDSSRDDQRKSGIVAARFPGTDPQQLRKRCLEAGVVVSCRAGRLRFSPHVYCNDADIEQLLAVLSSA